MTLLCITTEGLPGIRPCTHRGEHRVTCYTHPGWAPDYRDEDCTGCLPRKADVGFLCARCWDSLEQAWVKWGSFASALAELAAAGDRALVRDTGGRGSTPDGYVPFVGTYLAYDECVSFLASRRGRPLRVWVSNAEGARDAVQFARAAQAAYRTHETEERAHKVRRVRCPKCKQLTLVWEPTPLFGGDVTVTCQSEGCGHVMDQGSYERIAEIEAPSDEKKRRPKAVRASEACADGAHETCGSVSCPCDCHQRTRSLYTVQVPAHLLNENTRRRA